MNVAKNLMDAGSRPSFFASSRIAAIFGFRTSGLCPETKIASACLLAKEEPALAHWSVQAHRSKSYSNNSRRCAGLEQEGRSLRRWVADVPRLEVVILALMLDCPDFVRIKVCIIFCIGNDRIFAPRSFPEPGHVSTDPTPTVLK